MGYEIRSAEIEVFEELAERQAFLEIEGGDVWLIRNAQAGCNAFEISKRKRVSRNGSVLCTKFLEKSCGLG